MVQYRRRTILPSTTPQRNRFFSSIPTAAPLPPSGYQSLPAQARGNKMLSPAPGSDACESLHASLDLPPPLPPSSVPSPLYITEFSWCVQVRSERSPFPPSTALKNRSNNNLKYVIKNIKRNWLDFTSGILLIMLLMVNMASECVR